MHNIIPYKRIEVELPNGRKLNRSELPPPNTTRWVAKRKELVVQAVIYNLITFENALKIYSLSSEELNTWIRNAKIYGINGLKITFIQKYEKNVPNPTIIEE